MVKTLMLIYFLAGLGFQSVQAADITCGLSRHGAELKTDSRTITIKFVKDATFDSVTKDVYILTGAVQMTGLPKYQMPGVEKKVRDDDVDRINPFLESLSFTNDGKFQSWPKKDDTITVSAETKATVIAATVGGKKKMIEGSPTLFNVLKKIYVDDMNNAKLGKNPTLVRESSCDKLSKIEHSGYSPVAPSRREEGAAVQ